MNNIVIEQDKQRIFFTTLAIDLALSIIFMVLLLFNYNLLSQSIAIFINKYILLSIVFVLLAILIYYDTVYELKHIKIYEFSNNQVKEYQNYELTRIYDLGYIRHVTTHETFIDRAFDDITVSFDTVLELKQIKKNDAVSELINIMMRNSQQLNKINNLSQNQF